MILQGLNQKDQATAEKMLLLQRAAYAVEAALIDYPNLPPLHEPLDLLMQSKETFIGLMDGENLVGMASYQWLVENGQTTMDIYRLVVDPTAFRRGYAKKLLLGLINLCRDHHAHRLVVSTGRANEPAVRLYLSCGFVHLKDQQLPDGLWISHFEHHLD